MVASNEVSNIARDPVHAAKFLVRNSLTRSRGSSGLRRSRSIDEEEDGVLIVMA